jgi:glucose/arabinose dehydrogenase
LIRPATGARHIRSAFAASTFLLAGACGSGDGPVNPTPSTDFTIRRIVDTGGPETSVRLVRDPISNALFVLKRGGDVFRLTIPAPGAPSFERLYASVDTGTTDAQGMAFGPDGTLYVVGNQIDGLDGVATIRRGARTSGDERVWSTLAQTVPYPRSNTAFDHEWNGIAVSPDGRSLYVNSGSRTDHGEVQTSGGRYPGLREVPLTAKIFRLPAAGNGIVLPDDETLLESAGYVFARGVRNSFDPAFNAAGDLLSGDNSGDRDDNDELNWLREGGHYGFPWRMGTNDTPQQFPGYDPEADKLVDHRFYAYQHGFFHDDPTYPPRPSVPLTDPIPNLGADANSFRDPATGALLKASEVGRSLGTFTTHRSPLGLSFDNANVLAGRYRGGAFILGWTQGDPTGATAQGPFRDASQDLLFLDLQRTAAGYEVRAQSLVCGFLNPIDTEILNGRLYVLEFGGAGTVWEITTPAAEPAGRRPCTNVPR